MPYDDQTELFYLVDKNDKVLGFTARKQAHKDRSKIHRSVDVVATNSSKQILLQKRSKHKDTFPGFWTISASGHVTYGQTYEQAAKREIEEELGIHPPLRYVAKELYDMGINRASLFPGLDGLTYRLNEDFKRLSDLMLGGQIFDFLR